MYNQVQPFLISLLITLSIALRFSSDEIGFNLNENETAVDPLDYWGRWPNHTYHSSPENWRMPAYTLFLDRFVNGDPTNDDANGTQFEHDLQSTQFRYGGDVAGLHDTLDYLHGMGVKILYLAGSPFVNMPWGSDGYSPLDLTLLDRHFGNIDAWRNAIDEIHRRGMYVLLDNTFGTLGDLLGFKDHLNDSTVFSPGEYDVVYKSDREYHDFSFSNSEIQQCSYPRLWDADGHQLHNLSSYFTSCHDSEFDQYGDQQTAGNIQPYELQLLKFASVQDRLREWRIDVLAKIQHFSCLAISSLDIDGYRIDKATQVTLDAQGAWSAYIRKCAKQHNKENFFIVGEISTSNTFGSLYIGKGIEPEMSIINTTEAVLSTNESDRHYIRASDKSALDAAAFHYTIYRGIKRFLGIDGDLEAVGDPPVNFVDTWNALLQTNDMVNANTGLFDPRHMFGISNQDTFRWPSLSDGVERQLLGLFITTLLFPGIPTLYSGEEQALYILENLSDNYLFGRQPMSSSVAWQLHGCYSTGSTEPLGFDAALRGCHDDHVSMDHRDPGHPVRNIIKRMFEMREQYSALNDGYYLQQLSNHTHQVYLPQSKGTPTETGIWSVYRSSWPDVQSLPGEDQGVWLIYTNENRSQSYEFDCLSSDRLTAPFSAGTKVRNLFSPYEEYVLDGSAIPVSLGGQDQVYGCLSRLNMPAWGFKALVPFDTYMDSRPSVTHFAPGHDARIASTEDVANTINVTIGFSHQMDCSSIIEHISVKSRTQANVEASFDPSSLQCYPVDQPTAPFVGSVSTVTTVNVDLINAHHGLHRITVNNATSVDGMFTDTNDHFLLRVGSIDNPLVFPRTANYSQVLFRGENDHLEIHHSAPGADRWRYSLDFGTTYSDWKTYKGGVSTIAPPKWSGTKAQTWSGQHVMAQYWSRLAGSSDHYVHGDINHSERRFPNLFLEGKFNSFGADSGVDNKMRLKLNGNWEYGFMTEWPTKFSVNAWGVNADGKLDRTQIYGDIDGDHVLDRVSPQSVQDNSINTTIAPPFPYLAYKLELHDGTLRYELVPTGAQGIQILVYFLLASIPVVTAALTVYIYMGAFYKIKFNQFGTYSKGTFSSFAFWRKQRGSSPSRQLLLSSKPRHNKYVLIEKPSRHPSPLTSRGSSPARAPASVDLGITQTSVIGASSRQKILIATIEYDIEDWAIKVKIGGLGVMAQLMGKALGHQDLIWVVPCVGDVEYPHENHIGEPMEVMILDQVYHIQVFVHVFKNITYVLLDAPVFRQQTKTEPYPPRMDDIDSAIYYSAWNQCIAETMRRYNPDLYHINDYHGAVAPLYLLPETIPCALSLHNAEFQGLWPMRSREESDEVCRLYNLDPEVVKKYVKFGEVFNLLHAGASYLRIHQDGFGAVGVSKKYGKRSYARYPIFWGLKDIGALPNPDPSDTAEWSADTEELITSVQVDQNYETERAELRTKAQKWANLKIDATAELFVFVGRWSNQKGVDLIADVFPGVLEKHPKTQLICIGPVIDLYGKFASLKLARLMDLYPDRVFSKPEFTALPPEIFSGAEFALIPSRDEPFGLVAVEFGRKGALGVGARVGGLGQIPGWWYTVESTSTQHLLHQFKKAIEDALACPTAVRAELRARSAKTRFPVSVWVKALETLQKMAMEKHRQHSRVRHHRRSSAFPVVLSRPRPSRSISPSSERSTSPNGLRNLLNESTTQYARPAMIARMGSMRGPGYARYGVGETENCPMTADDDISDEEYFPYGPDDVLRGREMTKKHILMPPTELSVIPPTPLSPTNHRMSRSNFAPEVIDEEDESHLALPSFRSRSPSPSGSLFSLKNDSTLSLEAVLERGQSFELQRVNPSFSDSTGEYTQAYQALLEDLSSTNTSKTCVEDYIMRSEKDWFERYRQKKLGSMGTPASSVFRYRDTSPEAGCENDEENQFLLEQTYRPPTGLKKFMLRSIGGWPVYSVFLALGQIIAVGSYQITLLTGSGGEDETKVCAVSVLYLTASVMWWTLFRTFRAVHLLTLPFIFYGLAFGLIAISSAINGTSSKIWVVNVATGSYAIASSSGSFFFALNFGDQGGVPVKTWLLRACIIQGIQSIYTLALWLWGSTLTRLTQHSINPFSNKPAIVGPICGVIALLLCSVGGMLFFGLPSYYRQQPGHIPSFLPSIFRRKIVIWFLLFVFVQSLVLSPPLARSYLYLFSSQHVPLYAIILLIILFFVILWTGILAGVYKLTKTHPWFLPIMALGLGAPRWGQILWATSGIGAYVPWAIGGPVGSAVAGRVLWLWLGLLDSIQGVGIGVLLLQTLTRYHVAFTLIAGQVVGSIAVILGRVITDEIGWKGAFPNFGVIGVEGLGSALFWVVLILLVVVGNAGGLKFYRGEVLSKP